MTADNLHPIFNSILSAFTQSRIDEARKAAIEAYRRPPGECSYCDEHRNDSMMPSHTASSRCESGKRPHCTCDTCY